MLQAYIVEGGSFKPVSADLDKLSSVYWIDICEPTADEQKAVNLRSNRNVVLTTGCNEWERGLDVVVEGEAVGVDDESVLQRLANAWAEKWDGRWHYEVHDDGFRHEGAGGAVLVFAVKPAKVFAFARGTFGQTRHRFDG